MDITITLPSKNPYIQTDKKTMKKLFQKYIDNILFEISLYKEAEEAKKTPISELDNI